MPDDKITLITIHPVPKHYDAQVLKGHYHIDVTRENITGIDTREHIATVKSKSWAREIAEHLSHVYDVEFKETT